MKKLKKLFGFIFSHPVFLDSVNSSVLATSSVKRHDEGIMSFYCDATITARYTIVKIGATPGSTVQVAGYQDTPVGVCLDEDTDTTVPVAVRLFGGSARGTIVGVSAAAISIGDLLETGASGTVQTMVTTASSGNHWCIGIALTAATAASQAVEIQPTFQRFTF